MLFLFEYGQKLLFGLVAVQEILFTPLGEFTIVQAVMTGVGALAPQWSLVYMSVLFELLPEFTLFECLAGVGLPTMILLMTAKWILDFLPLM